MIADNHVIDCPTFHKSESSRHVDLTGLEKKMAKSAN